MRTTVEFPDNLLTEAKIQAARDRISLREFLILAVEEKLRPVRRKVRRNPPTVAGPSGSPIGLLNSDKVDEAVFGR